MTAHRAGRDRPPGCCMAGAVAWPDPCPWHDAWRTPIFLAPPAPTSSTDDDQEDDQS